MNDVIGLTNALTDIIVKVTPEELDKIGLKKGFWNLKREINREAFEELVKNKDKKLCQAGSPGNVVFNLAKLGFKTGWNKDFRPNGGDGRIHEIASLAENEKGQLQVTEAGERTIQRKKEILTALIKQMVE